MEFRPCARIEVRVRLRIFGSRVPRRICRTSLVGKSFKRSCDRLDTGLPPLDVQARDRAAGFLAVSTRFAEKHVPGMENHAGGNNIHP